MDLAIMIGIAFVMDLILGDPKGAPHPVRAMGKAAKWLEGISRKIIRNQKLAGSATVLILVIATYTVSWGLLDTLWHWNAQLSFVIEIVLIYTTFATRALYDESQPVLVAIRQGDEEQARRHLQNIVGRDTGQLNRQQIARATVETISENTVDGVIAPLFYACIGGAPLALTYKCINTLDSMFGYKNQTYIHFGWASARLDDAANWLPARIAGPLMVIAATLLGQNGKRAWSTMMRDGQNHLSPNAGIPEAVVAGALGVELSGPQYYQGRRVDKPAIGKALREIESEDIFRSHQILFVTAFLALVLFLSIRAGIGFHE
jgi:adenosylcobinamide-phosphate synthase